MPSIEEALAKKQKLGIDPATLSKLDDKVFANGNDPYFGIARQKVIALKLLLYDFNPTNNPPSALEKKIVQDFLKSIRGNMEFNKALKQIAQMGLAGKGQGALLIGKLITYIYKTRHFDLFGKAFSKLYDHYQSIIDNAKLEENEKISLKEYSNIYDIAHTKAILDGFAKKGFLDGDEEFTEFYKKVQLSSAMIMKIESNYRAPYNKSENIAVDDTTKQSGV